ncbi:MAG: hypothetical protein SPJ09_08755 [Erysipelotrichaceae bacterium]|nr:hypothetical protein [Erysipelotrichaceae bacterium]
MKRLFIRSKGFVSYYFISLLMIIVSVIMINCQIIYQKLLILDLLKSYDMQYKIIYILEFVKDNLDIIEDGTYDINDIEIEVTRYDDIIYISDLNDGISFEITTDDDHIIDYVLR